MRKFEYEKISSRKEYVYANFFDSITDLTNFLTTENPKPGRANESQCKSSSNGWFGTKTYEEAFEYLKFGDEKLYEKILKKNQKNKVEIDKKISIQTSKMQYKNDFFGEIPNVPNYLRGLPNSMIKSIKNKPSYKILNIYLNICVNAGVEPNEMIKIGSYYLTVIDLLERKGYRCNLYVGSTTTFFQDDYRCYTLLYTRVKTDKEPLNLKKICFPIANPAMLRRIEFKWLEVIDSEKDTTDDGGYGQVPDFNKTEEWLNDILGNKNKKIIWSYNISTNKTMEQILTNLEKQGIKIFD